MGFDTETAGKEGGGGAGGGGSPFQSAVVVDFIANPALITEDERALLKDGDDDEIKPLSNGSSYVDKMPRNSIIAIIVSEGKGKGNSGGEIFYPFFSPHFCLPIKPGEQVWVFKPPGAGLGYWMTRRATDINVDDLNYTHQDRTTLAKQDSTLDATDEYEGLEGDETTGDFPGGGRSKTSDNTLSGEEPYEIILTDSTDSEWGSYTQFTGESVPRFSKRCGDLTLQGSNNTLIALGENRVEIGTIDTDQETPGKGAIDIVVGRGQETDTAPIGTIENARGYEELDKNPKTTGAGEDLVEEGDPDPANDSSRIYLTMLSDPDTDFEISVEGVDPASEEAPSIVAKSTNIRLVAREDLRIVVGEEGTGSAVVLKSDGNIVFVPGSGGVIKLGGEDADLAILTSGVVAEGGDIGTVTVATISDTFGGQIGLGGSNGQWATKVLIK